MTTDSKTLEHLERDVLDHRARILGMVEALLDAPAGDHPRIIECLRTASASERAASAAYTAALDEQLRELGIEGVTHDA